MKRLNLLYEDFDQIELCMREGKLDKGEKYLILVHSTYHKIQEITELAEKLKKEFPESKVAGCSAGFVLYDGIPYEHGCVISFLSFSNTLAQVEVISYVGKGPRELAQEVNQRLCSYDTNAMFQFFSDEHIETTEYMMELNACNRRVKICGGKAVPVDDETEAYVFTEEGVFPNSVVSIAFHNPDMKVFTSRMIGHEPIGNVHVITEANGRFIYKIDDKDAVEWVKDIMRNAEYPDSVLNDPAEIQRLLLKFPAVLEEHHGASRFVEYVESHNAMAFFHEKAVVGQKFRVGYLSPMTSAEECLDACEMLRLKPVETIFSYSCVFRKLFLNRVAEWEMTPFIGAEICGAFLYGELANIEGCNEVLSGSSSLITLAEQDARIQIDTKAFNHVKRIDDDDQELLNQVLRYQNANERKTNSELMKQIGEQEKRVNERLFISSATGRGNLTMFMNEFREKRINKACLVTIEKGEISASMVGSQNFGRIMRQLIDDVEGYLKPSFRPDTFHYYMYDEYSFIVAADEHFKRERFLRATRELFAEFGIRTYSEFDFTCICRFAVVMEEENLVEKLRYTLHNNPDNLNRFCVYSPELGIENKAQKDMKMVGIIHDAIENDRIIPFFQPLYDNFTGGITKFEALMRITDAAGNIYYPNDFMPVSKEFRLYIPLSYAMISKVFDLFEEREEAVSINLSAFDINSDYITNMIFTRLKRMGRANNIIFEILESEEFRDKSTLANFISNVRKFGVKIAVDDFGSGYSNLMEIGALNPDIIKIDGQIVKNLLDDELSRKIVGTIMHLADAFEISTVAEYVENEELQSYVSREGIRYSQGYYYSKPVPYESISELLKRYPVKKN